MWSRTVSAFLLLVLLVCATPSALAQQVTFAIPKLIVNTSFLNVRTGPGVEFAVLMTVVGGTELPVLGVARDLVWFQVNTNAGVGWVNVEFTLPRGDFSRVPFVAAPPLRDPALGPGGGMAPPAAVAAAPSGNVVIVNTGNLNIRSGPGAGFASIAVVPGGTTLSVVGRARDNVWLFVQGDFGRGWLNREFVLLRGVLDTIPLIAAAEAAVTVPVGQGRGGGAARFTGLSVLGGDFYAGPGFGNIRLATAITGDLNTVLPLLNAMIVNGVQWYQVNLPPFGVGWTTQGQLRPLACSGESVAVLRVPTPLRFDGLSTQAPLPLAQGTEVFLRSAAVAGSVLVEDINGTRGFVSADTLEMRPDRVENRCDLIPAGVPGVAAPVPAGQGGGGGAPEAAPAPAGNIAIVNTGNLNVRSGPAASFASVAVVPGGTRLSVLGRSRDDVWFLVEGAFGRGWVNNTFVIFRGVYASIPVVN